MQREAKWTYWRELQAVSTDGLERDPAGGPCGYLVLDRERGLGADEQLRALEVPVARRPVQGRASLRSRKCWKWRFRAFERAYQ